MNLPVTEIGLSGAPEAVDVSMRSWSFPDYADPPVEYSAGTACDATEVEVEYDHQLVTPIISSIIDHVPISGSARVLNEPFGPCDESP